MRRPAVRARASIVRDVRLGKVEVGRIGRVAHDALDIELLELGDRLGRRLAVERRHVELVEREAEDVHVLQHPLLLDRLGDVDEAVLHAPAAQDLRRRHLVLRGDLDDRRLIESLAVAQRAVRLHLDALLLEELDGVLAVEEGVDLDLVDGWRHRRALHQLLEVLHRVVGHAERTNLPGFLRLLQLLVGGHVLARHRPVDAVEVNVVCPQVLERLLELRLHGFGTVVNRGRPHLGRQEELVARHAARCDPIADGGLVGVKLGAVKEAVAALDGQLDTVGRVRLIRWWRWRPASRAARAGRNHADLVGAIPCAHGTGVN
mmetsp:Transcript_1153/g.3019  ORF Transcript_1153/g.3019 Transcript_1153/m.3019 type:complete len:318 (+) Transcript_1153:402-1355(+)